MSRTHIVQGGDNLTSLALRYYGDPTLYPRIVQANSIIQNPSVIGVGWELIIPDIVEREQEIVIDFQGEEINAIVDNDPLEIAASNDDEVSILIDGVPFRLWQQVEINRSMDTIADVFTLTCPWEPTFPNGLPNTEFRQRFKPFQFKPVSVYIGGQRVLTGTLLGHNPEKGANYQNITIEGYSKPGIFQDITLPLGFWPFETDGQTLQQIAERLSSPFGFRVVFSEDSGAAFSGNDKVDIEPDRFIYDFLIQLARQRGFVISSDFQGRMLFQKTTTEPATQTIISEKQPYVKSGSKFNGQARYSSIVALGIAAEQGVGEVASVDDNTVKRTGVSRPLVMMATDTNQGALEAAALAKLGRTIAQSIEINVTVKGWRRPVDNRLWKDNTKIIYRSDSDMIYQDTEMLIRNVKYNLNPKGRTATLTLVFPECYSGEIRTSYPWD
jgi:prophage tail gpP-like protein